MPDLAPQIVVGCLLDVSGSMRSALEPGQSNEPAGDRLRAVLRAALKLAKAERQQNSSAFMFVGVFGLRTSEDDLNPQAADLCGIADALLNDSENNSSGHDLLIARANANNVSYISRHIKTKLSSQEARIVDAHLKLHPDQVQQFIDAIPPEEEVAGLRESSRQYSAGAGAALGCAVSVIVPGGIFAAPAVSLATIMAGEMASNSIEDSRVERSEALAFARRIQRDWLSDFETFRPRPIFEVVDILQRLQDQWLDHEDSDSRDVSQDDNDNLFDAIRQYMYGLTPMCYALRKARDAFRSKPEAERRVLVLMSDGISTDGDPSTAASDLQIEKVSIATVKLTDDRSGPQRALYYEVNPVWDEGTRNLFQISKRIHASTHPIPVLAAAGWAIPSVGELALFCTVCTVTALEEFCSLLLSARFGSTDALLDIVGRIRHDDYINNEHLAIRRRPTDQGQRGICYAHAAASVIHMALLRIVSRTGGIPSFNEIRDRILHSYPETEDGQYVTEVLSDACIWYRPLHFQEVDEEGARQAVLQRRPVLATFGLSKGWDEFCDHFDENATMRTSVLTEVQMVPHFNKEYDGGHAVLLVSCSPESLNFLNSWGGSWGDNGIFRIENPAVLEHKDEYLRLFDVYWMEEELTDAERQAFDARVDEELRRHAEEHESIFELEYRCPRCLDNSALADFRGSVRKALCPRCQGWFKPDPGNLAKAVYLRAGLNDVVQS